MSDECSVIESMTLKIDCSLLDGDLFKASLIQVNKVKMWRAIDETIFFLSHLKLLHKMFTLISFRPRWCVFIYKPIFWLSRSREMLDNFSSDRFSSIEIRERRKGHKSSWIKTISLFPSLRRGGSSERKRGEVSFRVVCTMILITHSQSVSLHRHHSRVLCWVWAEASAPVRQWRKI